VLRRLHTVQKYLSRLQSVLGSLLLLTVLYLNMGAVLYTLFAVEIPTVPILHYWLQGMIGPWQGSFSRTPHYRAFGDLREPQGEIDKVEVDLGRYFPGRHVDRENRLSIRGYSRPYQFGDSPEEQRAVAVIPRKFIPDSEEISFEDRTEILNRGVAILEQRVYREHLLPQLLALHNRHRPEESIRSIVLVMESWPTSREGYEAMKREPYLKTEVISEYP